MSENILQNIIQKKIEKVDKLKKSLDLKTLEELINKNEIEEKISKTKGCLFDEVNFLLGLVFIKNIKFI